ncbi:MAG TPA: bifunctional nuclease domain-containing protein [Saprospiraceae bacterium]|nr:bifunctional nuclease domain-containing protein [Saprospiraceae bacterium]
MDKIELHIVALSHSVTHSHNYAVVLGETHGNRRLPIVIGGFEAQAIAVAMEDMIPSRPLTHDLFKNALDTFDIEIREVIINNLLDGVFHAQLVCERNGEVYEIDSRTSDAIAMAVRCNCPIFTYEFILEAAGVAVEESETEGTEEKTGQKKKRSKPKSFKELSMEDLNALLEKVILEEDYEKAAKIRDEIARRGDQTESSKT